MKEEQLPYETTADYVARMQAQVAHIEKAIRAGNQPFEKQYDLLAERKELLDAIERAPDHQFVPWVRWYAEHDPDNSIQYCDGEAHLNLLSWDGAGFAARIQTLVEQVFQQQPTNSQGRRKALLAAHLPIPEGEWVKEE